MPEIFCTTLFPDGAVLTLQRGDTNQLELVTPRLIRNSNAWHQHGTSVSTLVLDRETATTLRDTLDKILKGELQ